jgi:hypothetical protein
MHKGFSVVLSMLLFSQLVQAETKMQRVALCQVENKNYSLLRMPGENDLMVLESDPRQPQKIARTTVASPSASGNRFDLPPYWRPQTLPASACKKTLQRRASLDEVIREFYVQSYFITGDPRPIEDIDELVRKGEAIPVKIRILCKSDELTDDVTLCNEVTLMDQRIPVDPR